MVLLKPKAKNSVDTGCVTQLTVRCMGPKEKATFNMALSANKWEPLFRLDLYADQYSYYQTVICNLMEICFPTKIVTRHTADKPWVTDWFRDLVRKRQQAHMRMVMRRCTPYGIENGQCNTVAKISPPPCVD
ncbi:hypothetical protein NP493_718g01003 [Ridgeia piscesae]|uniref:Uncharacterized protein n=1 Tax=Ridgeia piscesae TaxID=27915 RepID=A0AAD9KQW1_RIDPI|nr:hypothetical protein NP493_718g01003 [Ridgeia piscesae]